MSTNIKRKRNSNEDVGETKRGEKLYRGDGGEGGEGKGELALPLRLLLPPSPSLGEASFSSSLSAPELPARSKYNPGPDFESKINSFCNDVHDTVWKMPEMRALVNQMIREGKLPPLESMNDDDNVLGGEEEKEEGGGRLTAENKRNRRVKKREILNSRQKLCSAIDKTIHGTRGTRGTTTRSDDSKLHNIDYIYVPYKEIDEVDITDEDVVHIPEGIWDSVVLRIMDDPYVASSGRAYLHQTLLNNISNGRDPYTREHISNIFYPDRNLQQMANDWLVENTGFSFAEKKLAERIDEHLRKGDERIKKSGRGLGQALEENFKALQLLPTNRFLQKRFLDSVDYSAVNRDQLLFYLKFRPTDIRARELLLATDIFHNNEDEINEDAEEILKLDPYNLLALKSLWENEEDNRPLSVKRTGGGGSTTEETGRKPTEIEKQILSLQPSNENSPHDPTVRLQQKVRASLGRYDDILAVVTQQLEHKSPDPTEDYNNLTRQTSLLEKIGYNNYALAIYENWSEHLPEENVEEIYYVDTWRARLMIKMKLYEDALKVLDSLVARIPKDRESPAWFKEIESLREEALAGLKRLAESTEPAEPARLTYAV